MSCTEKHNIEKELFIGIPKDWGQFVPPLQYNYYGSVLLPNVFETLINIDNDGTVIPGIANHWSISKDGKTLTFEIDNTKKFSDGSSVSANDCKIAWEHGFSLTPESKNSALFDVFKYFKDIDTFFSSKKLAAVEVIDNKTLKISLSTPFRIILPYLAGVRFAIFKIVGTQYLGTGAYLVANKNIDNNNTISQNSDIHFQLNPFYTKYNLIKHTVYPRIQVRAISAKELEQIKMAQNNLPDVLLVAQTYDKKSLDKYTLHTSNYSAHRVIILNNKNKLFSNINNRKAFQSIIAKELIKNSEYQNILSDSFTEYDLQSFLHLQPGRLEKDVLKQVIHDGEKFEQAFIDTTKKTPLRFPKNDFFSQTFLSEKFLSHIGIHYKIIENDLDKNYFKIYYHDHDDIDLMGYAFSIGTLDPDGLRHIIAEEGAIHTPMISNIELTNMFMKALSVRTQKEMDEVYRQIAIKILTDVPYVHIGYMRHLVATNQAKIKLNSDLFELNNYLFENFKKND